MVAIILEREEQRRMVVGGRGPPSSGAVAKERNRCQPRSDGESSRRKRR
jgi:hypothetical protein